MALEAPFPEDEPRIKELLILCELPHEDITPEDLRHFLVLREKGEVIGVVGWRPSADSGFSGPLRSIRDIAAVGLDCT
jgi:N-acetylglutamate synthase-like GNAT family acetyltransferase